MKTTQETFVNNLRHLRRKHFSSQAAFAEKIGMSVRGYQKYEQGESEPTPSTLERFASALGCQPWELLTDSSSLPPSVRAQSEIAESYLDTINAQAKVLEDWTALTRTVPPEVIEAMLSYDWSKKGNPEKILVILGAAPTAVRQKAYK